MAQNADNDRDYTLWILLTQVRNVVYKSRERELSQYDITPEQAGALVAIILSGKEATIAEMGRRLVREPHSVANLLSRMERHGLVTRKVHKSRRKAATYQLTPKGQEAYAKSTKRESIHRAMSTLTEEERKILEVCLRKMLHASLKDMVNEMRPPWP